MTLFLVGLFRSHHDAVPMSFGLASPWPSLGLVAGGHP